MKKNYTAVLQKAENLTGKITLLILALFGTVICSSAQSAPQNDYAYTSFFSSAKGPFDATTVENNADASPPVISYTPLASTCTPGQRTIIATFTDADGMPAAGLGRPVLYWQINSGAFTASTGTFMSVAGTTSTYSFTLGAGTIAGNLVSYYFVAQDNVGNVIAKPSAGAAGYSTNPPKVTTDPTSPEFYVVQTTLTAGTYTVGAAVGNNFLTITDAVNAYNNSCLSGAVIFSLVDGNYDVSEVFPITIGNPQASATNTLTIKPVGVTTIQGSSSDAIFKLNGADYVTIDGSVGTTKSLTIINNNTGLNSSVIWLGSASASNGATHNTIRYCTITGNSSTTTLAGIVSSSGVIAGNAAEAANTDNTYFNNSINTCYNGMMLVGPAAGGETNNVISGTITGTTWNSVIGNNQATKKLGYRGILISNQTGVQVTTNKIEGISSAIGIGSDVEPTGGVIVSGIISGGIINGNTIDDITNTNAGLYPAVGISLQSTSTAAGFKVYNNFIYGVRAYGNNSIPGNNGIGISVISGGGYGIYYNTVHLHLPQQSSAGGISSCLFIGASVTGTGALDVRNNIFSDRRGAGTSGIDYAVYSSVPAIVFSNINYNDYYSLGPVGFIGGAARNTIANWQAATLMDGNSVAVTPIFTSAVTPIDLHLQVFSALNDQAQPIAGITTDIDLATRDAVKPDIGADEFIPPACSGNTGGTVTSDFLTVCTSGSVSLSASGFSTGLGITYQWQYSTSSATGPWINLTGETNPTSCNAPVINVTTWYHLVVTCAAGSPGSSNSLQITVYNPAIASVTNGSRCGPGTVSLSATGSPTTAIQWYTALTGGAPVYTGNPFVTPSLSTTTSYYVESTYLGSNGTVGLNDPSQATDISTQLTSWQVYFNVIQPTKLLTVDIYPLASGENFSIEVYNSAGTVLRTIPVTTTVSGGATAQTVDIQLPLPVGNGYYLYATAGLPTTGLTRNLTGAVYPYSSTDIVITGNEFNPNFYMCYYKWRFTNGCSSSPRTQVTANIGVSATLNVTATPAGICAGDNSNICVTSSNAAFNYTWTPGGLSGACQTVSPATTTTYTVNATDGTCTGTGTVTLTVNPASSNVVISPTSVTKCSSASAVQLTATGGDIVGVPLLQANFNAANSWVTANTSTGTATAITNSSWTMRPDGYVAASLTIHSNDNSQFYISNSDANSGFTRTTLTSPAFSLVGYTSANLSFWHNYQYFGSPQDSATVEISQNGTTWTVLAVYKSTKGTSTNFANPNISLNTWAGQATNYIRFRYSAHFDIFWAIDNVLVTGSNSGAPITWAPATGLYTNPAATSTYSYTTGTATPTIWAMPTTTTTYTATATPPNACQKTQTITVTVNSVTATITAPPGPYCPSDAVTVSVALTGTPPWNLTYSNGTPVTVNNIATSPYTFVVNPAATTAYSITAVSDANCTATAAEIAAMPSASINVNPSSVSTWRGVNSDWTDPLNWCGGVPVSTRDVSIPAIAILPIITQTTPVAHNIVIATGASITINSGGILSFTGNCTNDGTIINNGKIVMNGSTLQTFPGGTTGVITAMNDFEVNNAAGATINKGIKITGSLIPTAGTIGVNDTITLVSTNAATARVSALGATAGFSYGAIGKFSVERYIRIPSVDSVGWRFLATPLLAGQTIKQAWQEGETAPTYSPSGYGTQITGPSSAGTGFDVNTANPSMKTFNPSTLGWVSVPGTSTPLISTTEGYMIFIRGNRTSNTFGSFSNTTLRIRGQIKTGPIGPISTSIDGAFISVGNPYPSAIDFATTTRNGLLDVFYVWDPKLGSLFGGYQTIYGPGPVYSITPGGGSYTAGNTRIESGSAFFVKATATAVPHNISFAESNKVAGSYQVQRLTTVSKQLNTKLYSVGNSIRLNDGTITQFDGAYSNDMDDNDIPKLSNFGENIGVLRNGTVLAVERHAEIVDTDTLFYQLSGLRQIGYQLEFTPENIAQAGLTAYLEDAYLQTSTVISLNTVSVIDFNVTADPASKAVDRFRLVFQQAGIVPVTFTSISAYRQEKNVVVNWKVENELNIDHYEVERSSEGRSFKMIGSQVAKGNNSGVTQEYTWLDTEPFNGTNFYRIKSVGIGNDIKYSEIVKVSMTGQASMIVVYPNPVKDGLIGLSLNDQPEGNYDIKLLGVNGQLLLRHQFYHQGGSERIKIPVGTNLSKGVYNLEVIMPAKKKRSFKVVFE
ncbi:MAG: hypothetical protein QM737_01730 [Ferruginibacter sp.]